MTETKEGDTVVRFYIQPSASRTEIVGVHGDGPAARLKVRIAAPPVDGEANQELLRFLKKHTGIPAARIRILRGESSRSKDVLFVGITPAVIAGVISLS